MPALTASSAQAPAATTQKKNAITAHAYLAASLAEDAYPFVSKQPSIRWPLASLTKLMTAVIVLQRTPPDDTITTVEVPGAYVASLKHLPTGVQYRADDLLRVMLVESSNEAAESFAAAYPGGRTAFIEAMNAQAAAWELTDTHFDDPAGLSAGSQSTADDLLSLVRHVYTGYPSVFQITRLRSVGATSIPTASSTGALYTAVTTNEFAGTVAFLGGKTGYTDEAQGNLISLFSVGGTPTVFIVLGSADRFGETRILLAQATHPRQTPTSTP